MMNSTKSINSVGTEIWRNEIGRYHRLDGPAIIAKDGTQYWYFNDKRHRLDGPAYIGKDGTQEWFVNGERHRLDGPAFIEADGTQDWWVHDINITDEVNCWIKENNFTWPFNEGTLMQFKLRFL
jgi:hypothetical protein